MSNAYTLQEILAQIMKMVRNKGWGDENGIQDPRHVVMAMSAYTDFKLGKQYGFDGCAAPCCSYKLLTDAVAVADKLGVHTEVGPIYSSEFFYSEQNTGAVLEKLGVLAVEMEAAELYINAARAGKNALCICTISDDPFTGEELDAEQRQNSFTQMMEIALEIA